MCVAFHIIHGFSILYFPSHSKLLREPQCSFSEILKGNTLSSYCYTFLKGTLEFSVVTKREFAGAWAAWINQKYNKLDNQINVSAVLD